MGFFVYFCVHDTAWTSWPGFAKCCAGMARGQCLALSKVWRSSCTWDWRSLQFITTVCVLLKDSACDDDDDDDDDDDTVSPSGDT